MLLIIKMKNYERLVKLIKTEKITLTDKVFYFPCLTNKPKRIELEYYTIPDKKGNKKNSVLILPRGKNIEKRLLKGLIEQYELGYDWRDLYPSLRSILKKRSDFLQKEFPEPKRIDI